MAIRFTSPPKSRAPDWPKEVSGRVFVFAHKEHHLDEVQQRLPAERYVLVDDKPRILAAAKERLGDRLFTLHVCQGKYAHATEHDEFPPADRTVAVIADILSLDPTTYLGHSA